MSSKKRHTVTTIEKHEYWLIKRPTTAQFVCSTCPDTSRMLTLQDAAECAGVSQRTVCRWVEAGRVHFAETETGDLLICLAPLFV